VEYKERSYCYEEYYDFLWNDDVIPVVIYYLTDVLVIV
jgi:hypothetical protein